MYDLYIHAFKVCNDKGQCDMSEGTCTCNEGYNGLDCSGMNKNDKGNIHLLV